MRRRQFIISALLTAMLCTFAVAEKTGASRKHPKSDSNDAPLADVSSRGLTIVYAATQPASIHDAAQRIASAVNNSPLLKVMAGSSVPKMMSSDEFAKASPEKQALDNIVLVGTPDDPVIQQAWLRDARFIDAPKPGATPGLYVFGFGNLLGDIGYIESGRNPFLHSEVIKKTPYESEMVTVSGSTPAGVALATNALLNQGLINGVVASNFHRGETTLLDRDPLRPGIGTGNTLPAQIGDWKCIGITQAGEDEYRGVLADTGTEPSMIWREKFYQPGVWDGAGEDNAMQEFSAGLHRRAYGDTLWAAQFANPADAATAAVAIAKAAHLNKTKDRWTGKQGSFGFEKDSAGPLTLEVKGAWVMMSTVPGEM